MSSEKPQRPKGLGIATGIAIGTAIGIFMGNLAIGISVGIAMGAGFEYIHRQRTKNQ